MRLKELEMRVCTALAAICCSFLLGCGTSSPNTSNSLTEKSGKVGVTNKEAATVSLSHTEPYKKQFVDSIIAAASSGNADLDLLDTKTIATQVADILEIPKTRRAIFIEAAVEGYNENSLGKLIIEQVKDGGKFAFLRYSMRDGVDTAIFRSLTNDLALDYIEFAIPPINAAHPTLAPDVYTYSAAEWLSQATASVALLRKVADDHSVLAKLARGISFGKSDVQKLSQMIEQLNQQDFAGAIATYHSLPIAIKQCKICLVLRRSAAEAAQDDAEHLAAIEDMRKFCGDDPCIALLSIYLHASKKEFGKAMASIDSLERAVGGDPYLDALRASTLFEANDLDAAITLAKKSLASDSSFELSHWIVAQASMAKSDFAATTSALQSLQVLGKVTLAEISATPEFAPYAASPEFKAWKAEAQAKDSAKN